MTGGPGRVHVDALTCLTMQCEGKVHEAGNAMLSDTDLRALLDLEHRLTNDDPELARFFHELDQPLRQPGTGPVGRAAITTMLVVAAALLSVGISSAAMKVAAAGRQAVAPVPVLR